MSVIAFVGFASMGPTVHTGVKWQVLRQRPDAQGGNVQERAQRCDRTWGARGTRCFTLAIALRTLDSTARRIHAVAGLRGRRQGGGSWAACKVQGRGGRPSPPEGFPQPSASNRCSSLAILDASSFSLPGAMHTHLLQLLCRQPGAHEGTKGTLGTRALQSSPSSSGPPSVCASAPCSGSCPCSASTGSCQWCAAAWARSCQESLLRKSPLSELALPKRKHITDASGTTGPRFRNTAASDAFTFNVRVQTWMWYQLHQNLLSEGLRHCHVA